MLNVRKSIIFFIVILLYNKLDSDVIIVEPTPATLCVRFLNIENFPSISLVGMYDYDSFWKSNDYFLINSNNCEFIEKNYPMTIYAVKKDYLKNKDVDDIDYDHESNVRKANLTIDTKYYKDDYKDLTIEMGINIAGFSDNNLILYKSYLKLKYWNNTPDSIQYFKYNGDMSKLKKEF